MHDNHSMNVCVIGGAGYVGLITGIGLSQLGHQVINLDIDQDRIATLAAGESPIYESGIESLLRYSLNNGTISFTTDFAAAVSASQVIFIAVGTPPMEKGHPDLSQMISVAQQLAAQIDDYKLIVVKSTAPVGTLDLLRDLLSDRLEEGRDFDLVVNPEFLREGKGLQDFFYPDRIVIGTTSEKARCLINSLYQPLIDRDISWHENGITVVSTGPIPVIETDPATAQMIKYSSNAFLAARVSFINEIAELCGKVGADVNEVSLGMGYDPRIGHTYLQAGLGFGGPCLEKDLNALIKIAEGEDHEPHLLKAILDRNERQKTQMIAKLKEMCGDSLDRLTFAVFGLAFKAGTNDVRNSLAIGVVDRLAQEGAQVQAHDPVAIPEAKELRPDIIYCEDPYHAVEQADALLVLTEWPSFNDLDYKRIKRRMAFPRIFDGRNLLNPASVRELGFTYAGIGRP